MNVHADFLSVARRYLPQTSQIGQDAERMGVYDPPLSSDEERLIYGETHETRKSGGGNEKDT